MEMGGNFCQILELGGGLLLRDGEYTYIISETRTFTRNRSTVLTCTSPVFVLVVCQKTNVHSENRHLEACKSYIIYIYIAS